MHKGRFYPRILPSGWFGNFIDGNMPGMAYNARLVFRLIDHGVRDSGVFLASVREANRKLGFVEYSGGFSLGIQDFGLRMRVQLKQDTPNHEIGIFVVDNFGGSMIARWPILPDTVMVDTRGFSLGFGYTLDVATPPFLDINAFQGSAIPYPAQQWAPVF